MGSSAGRSSSTPPSADRSRVTTLVEVLLLGGDVTSATATEAHCVSMYPDADRDERLRAIFDRLRADQDEPG